MGTNHRIPRARTDAMAAGWRRGRAARGLALLAALALFALPNFRSNVAPPAGGDAVMLVHDCDGQGCIAPADGGPVLLDPVRFLWAAD